MSSSTSDSAEPGQTPGIVLGAGVTALAVVRALTKRNIRAHLVGPHGDIATGSRGVVPIHLGQRSQDDRSALLTAITSLSHGVLMPCDDEWLLAVARFLEERHDTFTSFIPRLTTVERLIDKGAFAILVDDIGIPRPRTWHLQNVDDLADIPERELTACFLKPRDAKAFNDDFGVKAFGLRDRADAEHQLALAMARGHHMVAQEFVPGTPEGHLCLDGFVDQNGRFCALLARRVLRTYPRRFGNTTDTVTVPLDEAGAAVEHLNRLFQHVGFRGLFEAEFVFDPRTGEHKIIEVNARPWWQIQLVAAAGVDMVHMAYLDALGADVAPQEHYVVGRRWVHTVPDLRSRLATGQAAPLPIHKPQAWWRATHAVFDRTDAVPGIIQLRRSARSALRQLTGRAIRRGSTLGSPR
jgi:predicted ATP-grasp superfamily ATP-dependent carboligase